MHLTADDGNVGKALEELEELRRMHDGVGDWRLVDQLFPSNLGPEVTTFRQQLRSDNRQRNVMSDSCGRFIGEGGYESTFRRISALLRRPRRESSIRQRLPRHLSALRLVLRPLGY